MEPLVCSFLTEKKIQMVKQSYENVCLCVLYVVLFSLFSNLQHSFIIYQTKHYSSQEKKKKTISDIHNIIRLQQTSLPATGSMDQSNTVLPLVFGPGFWLTAS